MFYNDEQVLSHFCPKYRGDVEKIEFYSLDKGSQYYKLPP